MLDYRKLNATNRKGSLSLSLSRLNPKKSGRKKVAGHPYYYFLDRYSGYFQIPIPLEDKKIKKNPLVPLELLRIGECLLRLWNVMRTQIIH